MACFIVPAAEAVVVTAAIIVAKKKEKKIEAPKLAGEHSFDQTDNTKIKWSKKLTWLAGLLWGGILLLAFEHLWHGEITLFPPFLTAMSNPEDKQAMLHEMATVGVTMSVTVTAVWGAVCAFVDSKVKKLKKSAV